MRASMRSHMSGGAVSGRASAASGANRPSHACTAARQAASPCMAAATREAVSAPNVPSTYSPANASRPAASFGRWKRSAGGEPLTTGTP
jgi:hypothetical protein